MAAEVSETFKVIRSMLRADTAFAAIAQPAGQPIADRIYAADQVPQTPTFPYVLIDFTAGSTFNGAGTARLMTRTRMLVRMVNKGPIDATMRTADKEMDRVLQNTVREVSEGFLFSARLESPLRRSYVDGANNKFNETGGYYAYWITKV